MANSNAPEQVGTRIAAVDNLPVNQKAQEIGHYLTQKLTTIEEVLPSNFKGEGQRLIRRAMLYFSSKAELHEVTLNSFLTSVVQAAELGLAMDGRLCHAVAYNCNVAPKGQPAKWEKRAQCMPDYKGLVSIAKRSNQVADMDGDVVGRNDHFKYGMIGATQVFEYTPSPDGHGELRGAFARVIQPNGLWAVEYMNLDQLNHIRSKSKAKDNGPWVTDTEQMMVKTVIRRLLKMYCDDPTFVRATEVDDLSDVIDGEFVTRGGDNRQRVRPSSIDITPPPALSAPAASPLPQRQEERREEEPPPPSKPRSQRQREEARQEQDQGEPEHDDSADRGLHELAGGPGTTTPPGMSADEAQALGQEYEMAFAEAKTQGEVEDVMRKLGDSGLPTNMRLGYVQMGNKRIRDIQAATGGGKKKPANGSLLPE